MDRHSGELVPASTVCLWFPKIDNPELEILEFEEVSCKRGASRAMLGGQAGRLGGSPGAVGVGLFVLRIVRLCGTRKLSDERRRPGRRTLGGERGTGEWRDCER